MASEEKAFSHFITAEGGMLKDGDKPFRFISFNVSNLNYIEDDMRFRQANPYRLPDEFEIRDCLATVRETGGKVVRLYTIPVRASSFPADAPSYVEAPGVFNEEAFRCLDKILALAGEYGVRVIIPFVNNWQWMGGRPSYAAFRDKDPEAFWTDPQLIDDIKTTIRYIIERKNTLTGTLYRDDPAVLAWETGNELCAPYSWTREIAAFIKSLDANHLVMDGSRGDFTNLIPSVQAQALSDSNIDIVTTHHFETDVSVILRHMDDTARAVAGRKVYLIADIGFASAVTLRNVLDHIISRPQAFAGALIWSLRFHNRDGGFYWHSEPFGGIYKGLHWPGFPSGQAYDEARMMRTIRRKAFEIRGLNEPALSVPEAPELMDTDTVTAISWKGAMGAIGYIVERAKQPEGPWTRIAPNVSDADTPYFPLFNDSSAHLGHSYYYRVLAMNRSGLSAPSNVIGPVTAGYKTKIDTMKSLDESVLSRTITPTSGNDRSYKEIRHRLTGGKGSEIVYSVPGRLTRLILYAFEQSSRYGLEVCSSENGHDWKELKVQTEEFASPETNYDYWRPKLYTFEADREAADLRFIKIVFRHEAQLARLAILYAHPGAS